MANSKIKLGEETLIDLTEDTVTAARLLEGYTAHGKDGNIIIGTVTPVQLGSFDAGTATPLPTSRTMTGLIGTPNNIIMVRVGRQGYGAANNGALTRFVYRYRADDITTRYYYDAIGFGAYEKYGEYGIVGEPILRNYISWDRNNNSVTINLPIADDGAGHSRQLVYKDQYLWIAW